VAEHEFGLLPRLFTTDTKLKVTSLVMHDSKTIVRSSTEKLEMWLAYKTVGMTMSICTNGKMS
jgi:hypothetical protein